MESVEGNEEVAVDNELTLPALPPSPTAAGCWPRCLCFRRSGDKYRSRAVRDASQGTTSNQRRLSSRKRQRTVIPVQRMTPSPAQSNKTRGLASRGGPANRCGPDDSGSPLPDGTAVAGSVSLVSDSVVFSGTAGASSSSSNGSNGCPGSNMSSACNVSSSVRLMGSREVARSGRKELLDLSRSIRSVLDDIVRARTVFMAERQMTPRDLATKSELERRAGSVAAASSATTATWSSTDATPAAAAFGGSGGSTLAAQWWNQACCHRFPLRLVSSLSGEEHTHTDAQATLATRAMDAVVHTIRGDQVHTSESWTATSSTQLYYPKSLSHIWSGLATSNVGSSPLGRDLVRSHLEHILREIEHDCACYGRFGVSSPALLFLCALCAECGAGSVGGGLAEALFDPVLHAQWRVTLCASVSKASCIDLWQPLTAHERVAAAVTTAATATAAVTLNRTTDTEIPPGFKSSAHTAPNRHPHTSGMAAGATDCRLSARIESSAKNDPTRTATEPTSVATPREHRNLHLLLAGQYPCQPRVPVAYVESPARVALDALSRQCGEAYLLRRVGALMSVRYMKVQRGLNNTADSFSATSHTARSSLSARTGSDSSLTAVQSRGKPVLDSQGNSSVDAPHARDPANQAVIQILGSRRHEKDICSDAAIESVVAHAEECIPQLQCPLQDQFVASALLLSALPLWILQQHQQQQLRQPTTRPVAAKQTLQAPQHQHSNATPSIIVHVPSSGAAVAYDFLVACAKTALRDANERLCSLAHSPLIAAARDDESWEVSCGDECAKSAAATTTAGCMSAMSMVTGALQLMENTRIEAATGSLRLHTAASKTTLSTGSSLAQGQHWRVMFNLRDSVPFYLDRHVLQVWGVFVRTFWSVRTNAVASAMVLTERESIPHPNAGATDEEIVEAEARQKSLATCVACLDELLSLLETAEPSAWYRAHRMHVAAFLTQELSQFSRAKMIAQRARRRRSRSHLRSHRAKLPAGKGGTALRRSGSGAMSAPESDSPAKRQALRRQRLAAAMQAQNQQLSLREMPTTQGMSGAGALSMDSEQEGDEGAVDSERETPSLAARGQGPNSMTTLTASSTTPSARPSSRTVSTEALEDSNGKASSAARACSVPKQDDSTKKRSGNTYDSVRSSPKFNVGDRVEGLCTLQSGRQRWFEAEITSMYRDSAGNSAQYCLRYDDGDVHDHKPEAEVRVSRRRRPRPTVPPVLNEALSQQSTTILASATTTNTPASTVPNDAAGRAPETNSESAPGSARSDEILSKADEMHLGIFRVDTMETVSSNDSATSPTILLRPSLPQEDALSGPGVTASAGNDQDGISSTTVPMGDYSDEDDEEDDGIFTVPSVFDLHGSGGSMSSASMAAAPVQASEPQEQSVSASAGQDDAARGGSVSTGGQPQSQRQRMITSTKFRRSLRSLHASCDHGASMGSLSSFIVVADSDSGADDDDDDDDDDEEEEEEDYVEDEAVVGAKEESGLDGNDRGAAAEADDDTAGGHLVSEKQIQENVYGNSSHVVVDGQAAGGLSHSAPKGRLDEQETSEGDAVVTCSATAMELNAAASVATTTTLPPTSSASSRVAGRRRSRSTIASRHSAQLHRRTPPGSDVEGDVSAHEADREDDLETEGEMDSDADYLITSSHARAFARSGHPQYRGQSTPSSRRSADPSSSSGVVMAAVASGTLLSERGAGGSSIHRKGGTTPPPPSHPPPAAQTRARHRALQLQQRGRTQSDGNAMDSDHDATDANSALPASGALAGAAVGSAGLPLALAAATVSPLTSARSTARVGPSPREELTQVVENDIGATESVTASELQAAVAALLIRLIFTPCGSGMNPVYVSSFSLSSPSGSSGSGLGFNALFAVRQWLCLASPRAVQRLSARVAKVTAHSFVAASSASSAMAPPSSSISSSVHLRGRSDSPSEWSDSSMSSARSPAHGPAGIRWSSSRELSDGKINSAEYVRGATEAEQFVKLACPSLVDAALSDAIQAATRSQRLGQGAFGQVLSITYNLASGDRRGRPVIGQVAATDGAGDSSAHKGRAGRESSVDVPTENAPQSHPRQQLQLATKLLSAERSAQERSLGLQVFTEVACLQRCADLGGVCRLIDFGSLDASRYFLAFERCAVSLRKWREMQMTKRTSSRGRAQGQALSTVPGTPPGEPSAHVAALSPAQLRVYLAIFQEVADAVACIHSRGVAHFDLKCDNILLRDLEGLQAAVSSAATNPEPQVQQAVSHASVAAAAVPKGLPPGSVCIGDFGEAIIAGSEITERYFSEVVQPMSVASLSGDDNKFAALHSASLDRRGSNLVQSLVDVSRPSIHEARARGTLCIQSPEMLLIGSHGGGRDAERKLASASSSSSWAVRHSQGREDAKPGNNGVATTGIGSSKQQAGPRTSGPIHATRHSSLAASSSWHDSPPRWRGTDANDLLHSMNSPSPNRMISAAPAWSYWETIANPGTADVLWQPTVCSVWAISPAFPSDVWSLGCLLFELLTCHHMFADSSEDFARFFVVALGGARSAEDLSRLQIPPGPWRSVSNILQTRATQKHGGVQPHDSSSQQPQQTNPDSLLYAYPQTQEALNTALSSCSPRTQLVVTSVLDSLLVRNPQGRPSAKWVARAISLLDRADESMHVFE